MQKIFDFLNKKYQPFLRFSITFAVALRIFSSSFSSALQYVLKKISLHNASVKEKKAAEQECKLLSQLKHPNIVAYKDSFENQGFIYIAMGYCEGGDLYNRLKQQNGTLLEERQVVEWFVQISMSLQVKS